MKTDPTYANRAARLAHKRQACPKLGSLPVLFRRALNKAIETLRPGILLAEHLVQTGQP
jgi:hypothetical protein